MLDAVTSSQSLRNSGPPTETAPQAITIECYGANQANAVGLDASEGKSGPPDGTAPQVLTIEHDGANASNAGLDASEGNRADGTAPQALTIERDGANQANAWPSMRPGDQVQSRWRHDRQGDAMPTGAVRKTEPVQTLLKGVLDQVLAAFAARGNDAIGLAALEGLEIRMANLGPGEVARIDGNVILVDDDAGGAGWSLDNLAATDLATLAMRVGRRGQPSRRCRAVGQSSAYRFRSATCAVGPAMVLSSQLPTPTVPGRPRRPPRRQPSCRRSWRRLRHRGRPRTPGPSPRPATPLRLLP